MEQSNIHITEVSVNEVEGLQIISAITFTETFAEHNSESDMQQYLNSNLSLKKLREELTNASSQFFFAKLNDQIIGYLKINFPDSQTEKSFSNSLEIERIYVLKEHQHHKIGHQLLNKAIEIAKGQRYPYLWLGVWEKNTKAINFYKKHGFIEFDKHIFQLGDDKQIDVLMKLNLN